MGMSSALTTVTWRVPSSARKFVVCSETLIPLVAAAAVAAHGLVEGGELGGVLTPPGRDELVEHGALLRAVGGAVGSEDRGHLHHRAPLLVEAGEAARRRPAGSPAPVQEPALVPATGSCVAACARRSPVGTTCTHGVWATVAEEGLERGGVGVGGAREGDEDAAGDPGALAEQGGGLGEEPLPRDDPVGGRGRLGGQPGQLVVPGQQGDAGRRPPRRLTACSPRRPAGRETDPTTAVRPVLANAASRPASRSAAKLPSTGQATPVVTGTPSALPRPVLAPTSRATVGSFGAVTTVAARSGSADGSAQRVCRPTPVARRVSRGATQGGDGVARTLGRARPSARVDGPGDRDGTGRARDVGAVEDPVDAAARSQRARPGAGAAWWRRWRRGWRRGAGSRARRCRAAATRTAWCAASRRRCARPRWCRRRCRAAGRRPGSPRTTGSGRGVRPGR